MVKSLLSEAEAKQIEAEVARVELGTSAELVVAVVPRSQDHWQVRVGLAVAWALAAGLGFLFLEPWREPALALAVQVLAGGAAFTASKWPPLLRLLISDEAAESAAQARAFQLFAERGLHGTRGRTALLLFVSELEHRVVLLGDRTIHQALGQQGWERYVELLLSHIKQGRACEGILQVLRQLEPQLAAVAPAGADDVNELPDAPLRG